MLTPQKKHLCMFGNASVASYPSCGFLQVEAADGGRVLVVLHGLSFTLPCGLFTPLEGKKTCPLKVIALLFFVSFTTNISILL